jgi:hypothetical protein
MVQTIETAKEILLTGFERGINTVNKWSTHGGEH